MKNWEQFNDKKEMKKFINSIFNKEIYERYITNFDLSYVEFYELNFNLYDMWEDTTSFLYTKLYNYRKDSGHNKPIRILLSEYLIILFCEFGNNILRNKLIKILEKEYETNDKVLDLYIKICNIPNNKVIEYFSWYYDNKELGLL